MRTPTPVVFVGVPNIFLYTGMYRVSEKAITARSKGLWTIYRIQWAVIRQ